MASGLKLGIMTWWVGARGQSGVFGGELRGAQARGGGLPARRARRGPRGARWRSRPGLQPLRPAARTSLTAAWLAGSRLVASPLDSHLGGARAVFDEGCAALGRQNTGREPRAPNAGGGSAGNAAPGTAAPTR
jgi:hypothetical protein